MVALTETPLRAKLKTLMERTVSDQAAHRNWHYAAVRPQTIISTYYGQTVYSDCSDGCRNLCRVVGVVDDPAGNAYQGFGNSTSIHLHLDHIPRSEMREGDIFTFGYWGGEHHACMVYDATDKNNPIVWNMGTEGQPVFRRLSDEIATHRGMIVTLCQLDLPDDPPKPVTPQDKLRAKTGFWSWMKWALGEGEWKKYGKSNKNVRPNVKKVIPLKWWKQRAQFMLNRKKANQASN